MFASSNLVRIDFPVGPLNLKYDEKDYSNPLISSPLTGHFVSSFNHIHHSSYHHHHHHHQNDIKSANIASHHHPNPLNPSPYSSPLSSYQYNCMSTVLLVSNLNDKNLNDRYTKSSDDLLSNGLEANHSSIKSSESRKCPICSKRLEEPDLYPHLNEEIDDYCRNECEDDKEISVDDCDTDEIYHKFPHPPIKSTRHETFLKIRSNRTRRLEGKHAKIPQKLWINENTEY